MVRQTITRLVDDTDGSEAVSTVVFAIEGVSYEIDLSEENRQKLMQALAPYVEVARRKDFTPGGRAVRKARRGQADLAAVRSWAAANGHLVAERGRISASIIEAYNAATHAAAVTADAFTAPAPAVAAAAPAVKKAPARKTPARKAEAKAQPPARTAAKKAPARKAAAKTAPVAKDQAKKKSARAVTPRKAAARTAAARKSAAR